MGHCELQGMVMRKTMGNNPNPRSMIMMDNLEDDTFANWVSSMEIHCKSYLLWLSKCDNVETANYYADLEPMGFTVLPPSLSSPEDTQFMTSCRWLVAIQ